MKRISYAAISLFLMGLSDSTSAYEISKEFSINGFADGQFQWTKEAASQGFILNDGAIYLKYAKPSVELFLDLPFSGKNASDSNFNFATEKAQAFVTVKPIEGLDFIAGQFDAIFGYEAADSIDSSFTQNASIARLIPTVHLGPMLSYGRNGVTIRGFISNPSDYGQLNARNPVFGGQLEFKHQSTGLYLKTGGSIHDAAGPAGLEVLVDIMAGIHSDFVNLDTQFDIQRIEGANTGYQILGILQGNITEEVSISGRGNWLKEADAANNYQVIELTAGPQYTPKGGLDGLKLKADYTLSLNQATSGAVRTKEHIIGAASFTGFNSADFARRQPETAEFEIRKSAFLISKTI